MPWIAQGQDKRPKTDLGYRSNMERFKVKKKDFKKNRYLSIGGSFNLLTYFGDLAPAENFISTDISQIKLGISAFARYHYRPRMSLKAELLYGRLTGEDYISANPQGVESRGRYIRNLSFRNDIFDFSLMSQLYFFKNYLSFRQRKSFNIYVNGGISIFYHDPKGKVPDFKPNNERYPNSGEWVSLRPLGTEGQFSPYYDRSPYSNIQISIPFGGGFSFKISEQLDLSVEVNYRLLLTDYIDDVSEKYVDLGALEGDLAKSMSDRSAEELAVSNGKNRDLSSTTKVQYISKYDGDLYTVIKGYGQETGAKRGGPSNDTFLVSSFKISYILNKTRGR